MIKDDRVKKDEFFSMPKEDRLSFEIEELEKKEIDIAIEKVYKKLNDKFDNK